LLTSDRLCYYTYNTVLTIVESLSSIGYFPNIIVRGLVIDTEIMFRFITLDVFFETRIPKLIEVVRIQSPLRLLTPTT
jgi:hypothetical protein